MGKSIPSPSRLQEFAKTIASERVQRAKLNKPISKARVLSAETGKSERLKLKMEKEKSKSKSKSESESGQNRVGLGEVVSDCVKRWFQDTLKEAKAGDSAMQVLVGQMYYSGYGIPRDAQKGRAWISRASKSRSSVWKVSDKHPGYNASDSDSDDVKGDAK